MNRAEERARTAAADCGMHPKDRDAAVGEAEGTNAGGRGARKEGADGAGRRMGSCGGLWRV